jgi:hypothetical protein
MSLDRLRATIQPLRHALLTHALYEEMRGPQALRIFMEHHVFAVWDFMSLLKALQQRLCCLSVPWAPAPHAVGCRLVNEIVLAEETDDDAHGGYASHFDLYRRAMTKFTADVAHFDRFLQIIVDGTDVRKALHAADVAPSIRHFVGHTFAVIESGDVSAIASTFTFGREDLLPDVFQRIVDEISEEAGSGLDDFRFYLRRHIELDGGEHGPLAARLVSSLCGDDEAKWRIAEQAAVRALEARLALWDDIRSQISRAAERAEGLTA